jgi:hypothetical protein
LAISDGIQIGSKTELLWEPPKAVRQCVMSVAVLINHLGGATYLPLARDRLEWPHVQPGVFWLTIRSVQPTPDIESELSLKSISRHLRQLSGPRPLVADIERTSPGDHQFGYGKAE